VYGSKLPKQSLASNVLVLVEMKIKIEPVFSVLTMSVQNVRDKFGYIGVKIAALFYYNKLILYLFVVNTLSAV